MCQAHSINADCCRSGNTISCYYQQLCSLRSLGELGQYHTSSPLQLYLLDLEALQLSRCLCVILIISDHL